MPKFPRFTSGSFGRLDFATMNDLFDRVEQLEAQLAMTGGKIRRSDTEIVVALTDSLISTSTGGVQKWKWTEAITDQDLAFQTTATRKAEGPAGATEYPLVGKSLSPGTIYLAKAVYDDTGKLFYRAIQEGGQNINVAFGRVLSATVITPDEKWRYGMERVQVSGGGFAQTSPTLNFDAINGCEQMPDPVPPAGGYYGVGFIPPSGLTQCKRNPIRQGIVVPCFEAGSGWAFSIPNGYTIVC